MTMDPAALARLEDELLAVADAGLNACPRLEPLIADFTSPTELPVEARELFADNLEMLFPDPKAAAAHEAAGALAVRLAHLGVDSLCLRDVLAALCRRLHQDWPDPAGLLRGLAILDAETPLPVVCRRWDAFRRLAVGARVWHESFGAGQVAEIDAFSDLVYVDFERRQRFSLIQLLEGLYFVLPGTLGEELLTAGPTTAAAKRPAAEFNRELAASFLPPLPRPRDTARLLLTPEPLNLRAFTTWQEARQPEADEGAAPERQWFAARSLQELAIALAKRPELDPTEENVAHLHRLLAHAAPNPRSAPRFAECLARLHALAGDPEWLRTVTAAVADHAVAWQREDVFFTAGSKQSSALMAHWLATSLLALGRQRFFELALGLPLELLQHADTVITEHEAGIEDFAAYVHDQLRRGGGTASAAVWLWHRHGRADEAFLTPAILVKLLGLPTSGKFIRGRRELMGLLLEEPDFLAALTDGGSRAGISNLANTLKRVSVIDPGERQSLLVKIVRLWPESEDVVEDRRRGDDDTIVVPRISSYRSLDAMRHELQDIINRQIPDNSAQIARARSYGDLRENAEFKAAKEKQRLLMARRHELEGYLATTEATDFRNVNIQDTVLPGCTVTIAVDGDTETYHVLGIWDSVVERRILSCDSPLGHRLLGKGVGDELTTPDDREATVTAIEPLSPELVEWAAADE